MVVPGATAFTVIQPGPSSTAWLRVSDSAAALWAAYGDPPGDGSRPAMELMLTIRPRLLFVTCTGCISGHASVFRISLLPRMVGLHDTAKRSGYSAVAGRMWTSQAGVQLCRSRSRLRLLESPAARKGSHFLSATMPSSRVHCGREEGARRGQARKGVLNARGERQAGKYRIVLALPVIGNVGDRGQHKLVPS